MYCLRPCRLQAERRNQRLFELGYDVIRFWVYQVRDDLENCFKILENWKDQNNS